MLRQFNSYDPTVDESYDEWAAKWICEQLTRSDVNQWQSGVMTDHVFSLMEAVGISAIEISGGDDNQKAVTVFG